MTPKPLRVAAVLATAAILVGACGDDDDGATETTAGAEAAEPTEGTAAPGSTESSAGPAPADSSASTDGAEAGWRVDTADCIDPDRANAPIDGTIDIAASAPLSGGPAAAAFSPVVAGYQSYIDYANEQGLLPGHEIVLSVGDDQYDPALTPGVIAAALDSGADLISGTLGTPANAAIRDMLNEECVPQLLAVSGAPMFGEPVDYPWTIGSALPYNKESAAYAAHMAGEFPDGATVAVYYVNNEVGSAYRDAIDELAGEYNLEIVDEQTIDVAETTPPAAQLTSIAGSEPDVIVAVPLGAQCSTFLAELANQKAANAGWEPRVYLTSTCSSPLILGPAGAAADGILTTDPTGSVEIDNREAREIPGVAEYLSYIEGKGLSDTIPTSLTGWITGELTVEILRRAAESPDGLTPASIINTARNFEYTPSVARPGIVYKTSGERDPFLVETVQVLQYDAENQKFNEIGELVTEFESS